MKNVKNQNFQKDCKLQNPKLPKRVQVLKSEGFTKVKNSQQ